ncbi:MAG TPA: right-handed parallel beta-helix repeat-containing protein [Candidatus Bathyarchaeia archaeon]|nr:right-handed parallel beta-helix repeat-containing protein [Candidatus Bathyarchaeia archaeon]
MSIPSKVMKPVLLILQAALLFSSLAGVPLFMNAAGLSSGLIGAQISQNTTWTVSGSPYIITSDILVEGGATLTIEPGVEIKFQGNYSLIVSGSLQALGTETSSIVFTSGKPQPTPGDWGTIKFNGTQNERFQMRNAVVEYARYGITVQSLGTAEIESSKIAHCLISGVHVEGRNHVNIRDSLIEINGNGVSSSGDIVSGLSIVDSVIQHNENGIRLEAWATRGATISDVAIIGNNVVHNGRGLYFFIWAGFFDYDISRILNVVISNNTVAYNFDGIYLYSGGPWFGSIYNASVLGNRVVFNQAGLYVYANFHHVSSEFDVLVSENVISENVGFGIFISGGRSRPVEEGVKTKIAGNSISYNGYGVNVTGDTYNVAGMNDIYGNVYGMNVTDEAVVNAEFNFWGDASGPYHPALNPGGKGNPVDGNGVDLDFTPFLLSAVANERPFALLEADKSLLAVNEAVTFNASKSGDDGRIERYFFDFGDGSDSGWVFEPTVIHAYVLPGNFTVFLSVIDDLGFGSGSNASLVLRALPTLVVAMVLNAPSVSVGGELIIDVYVTDGLSAVAGVNITFFSNASGVFSLQRGVTDLEGSFQVKFTVPSIAERQVVELVVNASKDGYWSGQSQRDVVVSPRFLDVWLTGLVIVVVAAVAFVVIVVFWRKRRKSK